MAVATNLARARNRYTAVCLLSGLDETGVHPRSVVVPELDRAIEVKIASTEDDWRQAFQLVADSYRWRGYERPGQHSLRFTPYHALPDTVVLVAKLGERVLATFSLIADNHLLGLPLERLYPVEVGRLRDAGRRIVETSCLADKGLGTREFLHVFLAMIRLGWHHALTHAAYANATNVITVNPRHRSFYTKLLGYLPLGPVRTYEQVEGHPAEAYMIDAEKMRERSPRMHAAIFGSRTAPGTLCVRRMPEELVRRFAAHSTQTDVATIDRLLERLRRGHPRRWGCPAQLDPVGMSSILTTLALRRG
ncbi:MAG: hypothetical protein AB7K24_20205 [Gemmataceae bacterium]